MFILIYRLGMKHRVSNIISRVVRRNIDYVDYVWGVYIQILTKVKKLHFWTSQWGTRPFMHIPMPVVILAQIRYHWNISQTTKQFAFVLYIFITVLCLWTRPNVPIIVIFLHNKPRITAIISTTALTSIVKKATIACKCIQLAARAFNYSRYQSNKSLYFR